MNSTSTYSSAMWYSTNQSNFNGLNNASILSYSLTRFRSFKAILLPELHSAGKFREGIHLLAFFSIQKSPASCFRSPLFSPSLTSPIVSFNFSFSRFCFYVSVVFTNSDPLPAFSKALCSCTRPTQIFPERLISRSLT